MIRKRHYYYIYILIAFPVISTLAFETQCYDTFNRPRKCYPEFINAAYNLSVIASNTCGSTPTEYCMQHFASLHSPNNEYHRKICHVCDSRYPDKSHPAEYLTDYNNQAKQTWWQSETMYEDIQYPNSVNLTLNLGKSFEITYIQIKFHSPRPESFAIYKKTNETSDWIPYQYYSASCESTYQTTTNLDSITRENEAIALCTDEFSDIAPLTGGSVAFSTLEGRPSAYSFETSEELKEWVTATDLRIVLNRLNTFGDEVFRDETVLRSYYYAISDISIGGRCKCNGHAEKCVMRQGENFEERLKCDCKHNTDGTDCEKCLPFYNDIPWAPATLIDAHECKPCNCSGLSNKCFFDRELYEKTGHGGHCVECERNTDGVHCEHCKLGFYRSEYNNECISCQCHPLGSESLQCDPSGKCRCKSGVTGIKCDRCESNYYDLNDEGCKACNCDKIGSIDSPPWCDPRDGKCRCKLNVEGKNCDKCKPGYFVHTFENLWECLPCFCFGHSSECTGSTMYHRTNISSDFSNSDENWSVVDLYDQIISLNYNESIKNIYVFTNNKELWFSTPIFGNQINSYNQELIFKMRFNRDFPKQSRKDVILENSNIGFKIYKSLNYYEFKSEYDNTDIYQEFTVRLKETDGWIPTLSPKDFQRLLSNLTAIKIKASFSSSDWTYLKSFIMNSASKVSDNAVGSLEKANWVEDCVCPLGYLGQHCENCQVGYRREIQNGDSLTRCVPCLCNNHSKDCDQNSGKCYCTHHTYGDNCEKCEDGYYGNALYGTPSDCKKCQCPNNGPCAEIFNYQSNSIDIVCLNCPEGYQGNLCELCEDGYFMNKETGKCERCTCNDNIDTNAIGNCDVSNGKCIRCVYNTTGDYCENCLPGYWGNALTSLKCHGCECYKLGTTIGSDGRETPCNLVDGSCDCKPNVIGKKCHQCAVNYWNISSGFGCIECKCDPLGSLNLSCNTLTGQCYCKPGVIGTKCDQCASLHYGFSDVGCKPCFCDPLGSESLQCNDFGICKCKENIVGSKCNNCAENRYNFTQGCLLCDECYNLVQKKVANLRERIMSAEKLFKKLPNQQILSNKIASEIINKFDELKASIDTLHNKFFNSNDEFIRISFNESIKRLQQSIKDLFNEYKITHSKYERNEKNYEYLETLIEKIGNLELQLSFISKSFDEAEEDLNILKTEIASKNPNEKRTIQSLAQFAREKAENDASLVYEFGNNINQTINNTFKSREQIKDIMFRTRQLNFGISNFDLEKIKGEVNDFLSQIEVIKESLKTDDQQLLMKELSVLRFNDDAYNNDADELKEFCEELNEKGHELKIEIDTLSEKIKQYVSKEQFSSIRLAESKFDSVKTKEKDYINLIKVVGKNKILVDKSIDDISQLYLNLTKIFKVLEEFNAIKEEGIKNLKAAKLNLESTYNNLIKISDLLKDIKNNFQLLQGETDQIKSMIKISTDRINEDLNERKNETPKLQEKTTNLLTKSIEIHENFKKIETNLEDSNALHKKHSSILDNQYKQAEKMIDDSYGLYNKINYAIDNLNGLDKTKLSISKITPNELAELQDKFQRWLNKLDENSEYDDEINGLQNFNKKLFTRIDELESIIPILNKKITNLNEIHKNIESLDCSSDSKYLIKTDDSYK